MGVSVEVKGGWRINTFLFLLTGSQAMVLLWAPVILKSTNLSAQNVGVVMAVITLVGSVGIHGCLSAMKRTHSGAARRLMLLVLTLTGSVFYTASVLLVPAYSAGNSCSSSSSVSTVVAKPPVPPDIDSGFSLLATTSVLSGITVPHTESNINFTAKENDTPLTTKTNNPNGNSSISLTTPKETENVVNSSQSSKHTTHDKGKVSTKLPTPSVKKSESTSIAADSTTKNIKTTSNIVGANKATIPSVPYEEKKPEELVQSQITSVGDRSSEKAINGSENLDTVNSVTHKGTASQKYNTSQASQSNFHSSVQVTGTIPSKGGKYDLQDSNGMKTSYSGENNDSTSSSTFDDLYYYYEDEDSESKSQPEPRAQIFKQKHKFLPRKNQYSYKTLKNSLEDQQPEMDQFVPANKYPRFQNRKGSFNDYAEGLSLQGLKNTNKWNKVFVKPELTNKVEASKTLYLSDGQAPNLHSGHDRDSEKEKYDYYGEGYHLQNHPFLKTSKKSFASYTNLYDKRIKRSFDPSQIPSSREKIRRENVATTKDTSSAESRNMSIAKKSYVRTLALNIESPVGIQTGVAILLILGTLASAGVEAGVAQLWHCYSHGYDEGGVSNDILQRTITHTFQISVYATHKTWSGLTSGAWVIGGGIIAGLVCLMGVDAGVYGLLGGLQLALGLCAVFMVLVIPVPYGSVDPPKTRRPLSLYLDDEVLREGVRRLAFHIWVLANGCVSALSLTFGLWLVLERTGEHGHPIAAQTGAVSISLASESLTLWVQKWLMARVGLQGTMGISGLALMTHLTLMWVCGNVALLVISFAGLGICMALLWVSIRHNALLLATVNDQERESWVSWWCWRIGVGVGSVIWGSCVDASTSLSLLFKPAAFLSASIAFVVASAAVMTRSQGKARRRIYHTLDLDMAVDDEDDDEEADEDDWLVKRAKKEGINL